MIEEDISLRPSWQFVHGNSLPDWMLHAIRDGVVMAKDEDTIRVWNSRGGEIANRGDWIIRHPFGDLYVRKAGEEA
jgi:hypothetical protein